MGTILGTSFNVAGGSRPERVSGGLVPADFFNVLGLRPLMGRFFEPEEDQPGGPRLAILSYGLWQRAFGADPATVGRTISLSGESYQVVAVLPPDFYRAPIEVWVPLQLRVDLSNALDRGGFNYFILARLKPALSLEQANQDMDRVTNLFRETYPDLVGPQTIGMRVERYQDWLRGPYRPILMILLGAVAFVLLIACANVANLLLSRITTRRREISIRRALGASPVRILNQLAIENLLLGLLGGLAGLLLASWTLNLILGLVPVDVPGLKNVALDRHVLGFTLLLSLAVGLLLAASASVHVGKVNLADSLKATGLGGRSSVGRHRLAYTLVVGQVGLSLILLVGTLLLVTTLGNLYGVDLGFETEDLTVVEFSLAARQYESEVNVLNFERRLLEEIQALPGVVSVATGTNAPLVRGLNTVLSPLDPGREELSVYTEYRGVSPDYFQTLGIPVVQGRGFLPTDSQSAPPVAVVNESMARRAWPGEDPLGKRSFCAGASVISKNRHGKWWAWWRTSGMWLLGDHRRSLSF